MKNEYILNSNDRYSSLKISNIDYYETDAQGGNPYNTTAIIEVNSNGFSGVSKFIFDIKSFREFIANINDSYKKLSGDFKFIDLCYGSELKFEFQKFGHICISGILYGEAAVQQLKFEFITDQAVIPIFLKELNNDWMK